MSLGTRIKRLRRRLRLSERLREGQREELEHAKTIRHIKRNPKIAVKDAAALIAEDHIVQSPDYYKTLKTAEELAAATKRKKQLKHPRIKLLGRRGRLRIYLVDGKWIREHKHIDYVHGGHDVVYPGFVPAWEVWIDNTLMPNEIPYVTWHELFERRMMSKHGWDYNKAHDEASRRELEWRHGKRGFKAALRAERGQ